MTQTLSAVFDWKSICGSSSFTLITEAKLANAGFLLSYAVSEHLNRGYRDGTLTAACFVAIAQTREHYQQVGLKLGVNLNRCEEQGRLAFVDGLRSTSDLLKSTAKKRDVDGLEGKHVPCLFSDSSDRECCGDGLRHLYEQVRSAVHRVTSNGTAKCLLVVDDLSLLLYIGISMKEILGFVEYCRRLAASVGASLVALAHGSISLTQTEKNCDDDDDEEQNSLCRYLAHRSNTVIRVADLVSGYSKEISGEMIMLHRRIKDNIKEGISSKSRWHFKVEDKRVVLIAPGFSPAVL